MKKNENHNSITKNVIKASVKGAIGNVPILGSFFNEYFSLIEENSPYDHIIRRICVYMHHLISVILFSS